MSTHKLDIEHNLRIYTGSYIAIKKTDGEIKYGKLLWVEFDEQKLEYYAELFFEENVLRIYENEIEEIIPNYEIKNNSIINSARTILSEKYILWDNGVITNRSSTFPVVNIVDEGESIRVDYCRDLSAEDVEFFEVFEKPAVDTIVLSVESNLNKYAKKKTAWFWRKK